MKCSYCHKVLTSTHTCSLGMPSVKQVFGCSRPECQLSRKHKKFNRAIIEMLEKMTLHLKTITAKMKDQES